MSDFRQRLTINNDLAYLAQVRELVRSAVQRGSVILVGPLLGALVEALLDEREIDILWKRYRDGMTLDQAGACYDVTRERTRQIEKEALIKLRNVSTLRTFLEA